MKYLLHDKKEDYELKYDTYIGSGSRLKQIDRETQLVKLMRIGMLKRLESSIHSFKLTTEKILYKIKMVLEKIEKGDIDYNSDIDINLIDPDDDEFNDMMIGSKQKVLLKDIDLLKWSGDLNRDVEKLEHILEEVRQITPERDEKLNRLREIILDKVSNPINNNQNKKIVIFTAFADTAKYLYDNIYKWALNDLELHSALVTGSGNNKTTLKSVKSNDIDDILTNFSPISKERSKIYPEITEEIDILIGTDCISEGQNLQDCDYLINYDIHWNPVRIIQRFGRIDRIGSKNKYIQLHNFWPNMELNEYIDLSGRVESRMVMVDVSSTGDDNPIANEPIESYQAIKTEIGYREKQLQRLKNEVVDLEDVSGGISITDLTFNDFKVELMEYLKEHKKELEEVPNGVYSIVEIDEEFKDDLSEGVIFLLRQTRGIADSKDQNPLTPYYLIHVNEDGTIAFNYTSSKKIMDFYKKLCSGKREVFKELVEEFNKETKDGTKMEKYSDLLKIAIEGILGKKEDVGKKSVFTKGGTNPVRGNISGIDEFELITFLILK